MGESVNTMNKKIIIFGLLFFSVFLTGCNNQVNSQNENSTTNPSAQTQEKPNATTQVSKVDRIEVFYFHSTNRCISCKKLERYTRSTVEEYYQPQMRDGLVIFNSFNVDESENKEIARKFRATGSSLFINVVKDGKDNISQDTKVWRLLGNAAGFKSYLKNKIDTLLK